LSILKKLKKIYIQTVQEKELRRTAARKLENKNISTQKIAKVIIVFLPRK
jgi:hypothetical protein